MPTNMPGSLDAWVAKVDFSDTVSAAHVNNLQLAMAEVEKITVGPVWTNVRSAAYAGGAKGDGTTDDTAAIQAAINVATSGTFGPLVYLPPGNYRITSSLTFPTPSVNTVVIRGAGDVTKISPSGAFPAFVSTGTQTLADPRFENFQVIGGTYAFETTSVGQVIRLLFDKVRFVSQTLGAIHFAGPVIGFTFQNCLFSQIAGDTFNHDGVSQINNGHWEDCWFQSATFRTYINIPCTTSIVDDLKFSRCLFEGPNNANTVATMVLGTMTNVKFSQCEWADFSVVNGKPLIQTVASAAGAPSYVSFEACNFSTGDGAIFQILVGNTFTGHHWAFVACSLTPKPATAPFDFSSGSSINNLSFVSTNLQVAQPWTTQVVTYIASTEVGVVLPFKTWNAATIASGALTMGDAAAQIVGGATSLALRNNANNANNLLVTDAGLATHRNAIEVPYAAAAALPTHSYGTLPVKIDDQLLAGAVATVTFVNPLPTGFRHLLIEWYARGDNASANIELRLRFNNISTTTYEWQYMQGAGASATAVEGLTQPQIFLANIPAASATANYFGQGTATVKHYNGTVGNKLVTAETLYATADTTGALVRQSTAGKWRTTATAVTRIDLFTNAGNFIVGSIFTLYGIP